MIACWCVWWRGGFSPLFAKKGRRGRPRLSPPHDERAKKKSTACQPQGGLSVVCSRQIHSCSPSTRHTSRRTVRTTHNTTRLQMLHLRWFVSNKNTDLGRQPTISITIHCYIQVYDTVPVPLIFTIWFSTILY
jgi:hypothetical protein